MSDLSESEASPYAGLTRRQIRERERAEAVEERAGGQAPAAPKPTSTGAPILLTRRQIREQANQGNPPLTRHDVIKNRRRDGLSFFKPSSVFTRRRIIAMASAATAAFALTWIITGTNHDGAVTAEHSTTPTNSVIAPAATVALSASVRGNTVEVSWNTPIPLAKGDTIVVRRTPRNPHAGTPAATGGTVSKTVSAASAATRTVTFQDCDPGTTYVYTLAVISPNTEPREVSSITVATPTNIAAITPNAPLTLANRLVSPNGAYELAFDKTGSLILSPTVGDGPTTTVFTGQSADTAETFSILGDDNIGLTYGGKLTWVSYGTSPQGKTAADPSFTITDSGTLQLAWGSDIVFTYNPADHTHDVGYYVSQAIMRSPLAGPLTITSPWGWRIQPITYDREFHPGLDLLADCGAPIYATAAGTVTFTGMHGNDGNRTEIDNGTLDGHAVTTTYNHQSQILVSVGQKVTAGQIIGHVGETGLATGCHLHYEVYLDGQDADSENFLADFLSTIHAHVQPFKPEFVPADQSVKLASD